MIVSLAKCLAPQAILLGAFIYAIIAHMAIGKNIFIGVAWPYVNGDLHVGHLAGYLLPADIFARFNRFIGNNVLMVSGSDCFGTPITVEADKRGVKPQVIVDEYHPKNVELFKKIGISFDVYTKTLEAAHQKLVQDFFVAMLKEGLITRDKTEQYYDPVEKRFLPDRYVEGTCPVCKTEGARSDQCETCNRLLNQGELINPVSKITRKPVELKETEHYFADWAGMEKFLKQYVESRGPNWRTWVYKETQGWLKSGLTSRAITRDLDWGVEIPADRIPDNLKITGLEHKRIYVWFDAVIGYLSASKQWKGTEQNGTKLTWESFWYDEANSPDHQDNRADHYYFMGKDNLVFHTLFWPGQLHAYDPKLHLPDFPAINQFLTVEGHKFSKSRGITVDSRYITDAYGVDPVRFYFASIFPEHGDANFSWQDFVERHNSVLIGNLGNFINRTVTLAKDIDWSKPFAVTAEVEEQINSQLIACKEAGQDVELKKYIEELLKLADFGNKYLAKNEPWKIRKTDAAKFTQIIGDALMITLTLQALITPVIPDTAKKMGDMLGVSVKTWPDSTDTLVDLLHSLKISKPSPLFSQIDPKIVEQENAKLNLPKAKNG